LCRNFFLFHQAYVKRLKNQNFIIFHFNHQINCVRIFETLTKFECENLFTACKCMLQLMNMVIFNVKITEESFSDTMDLSNLDKNCLQWQWLDIIRPQKYIWIISMFHAQSKGPDCDLRSWVVSASPNHMPTKNQQSTHEFSSPELRQIINALSKTI